ncbi:MAG: M48 family metallopeptidase [Rhodobacteraceae bacterium]|nr:M48 family metallopeptidase [Paracoccaceae bacterium]
MANHILRGVPPIPLVMRRSTRARRISLRVSQLDGRVTLTLPNGVPDGEALEFAETKAPWIRKHLMARRDDVLMSLGTVLPIEGVPCRITCAPKRQIIMGQITKGMGEIAVPDGRIGPRLQSWLRTLARDRLVKASDHYAEQLGREYMRITLRDTRSRWGSCSSAQALMFSWRLILAPPEVLRYVAAHEVAHLAEMNHSPAFWAKVTTLYGAYEAPRKWLRKNGSELHRYRFDSLAGI